MNDTETKSLDAELEFRSCVAFRRDSAILRTTTSATAPGSTLMRGFCSSKFPPIFVSLSLFFIGQIVKSTTPLPQIWFGMPGTQMADGSRNWDRMFFQNDASWPEVLSHVQVITVAEAILNHLSEADLTKVVAQLDRHHVSLAIAILAQSWVNEPKCGFGVEGYSDPPANAKLANELQRAGGRIAYLAMDGPLFAGHYYDGQNACHSSIDNVAERASAIVREYQKVFPNVTLIDSEPFPSMSGRPGWEDSYKHWLQAFRNGVGRPIAGMQIDINWPTRWQEDLQLVVSFAHGQHLSVGIIYGADPFASPGAVVTNDLWLSSAVQNFNQIERGMGIVPDQVIFESWSRFPERSLSDKDGFGEDYLVKQYLLMKAQH